jgi:hypothetical protein
VAVTTRPDSHALLQQAGLVREAGVSNVKIQPVCRRSMPRGTASTTLNFVRQPDATKPLLPLERMARSTTRVLQNSRAGLPYKDCCPFIPAIRLSRATLNSLQLSPPPSSPLLQCGSPHSFGSLLHTSDCRLPCAKLDSRATTLHSLKRPSILRSSNLVLATIYCLSDKVLCNHD